MLRVGVLYHLRHVHRHGCRSLDGGASDRELFRGSSFHR
jgi:hypothetical protein